MKLSSRKRRERRRFRRLQRNARPIPYGEFLSAWDALNRAYIKRINDDFWRMLPDYL